MNIGASINASIVASYTSTANGARNPLPAPGNGNTKPANLNPDARLDEKDKAQAKNNNTHQRSSTSEQRLDQDEQREIQKLQQRDREVRAHEAAHQAAGGPYVRGGAQFDYDRGPDGRLYAVGGEVSIDSSPIPDDPEATLRKANQVRAAALAPADPSPQDRAVAMEATLMAADARAEILKQQQEETTAQKEQSAERRAEMNEQPPASNKRPGTSATNAYQQNLMPNNLLGGRLDLSA